MYTYVYQQWATSAHHLLSTHALNKCDFDKFIKDNN
jgi:hypothetical protein